MAKTDKNRGKAKGARGKGKEKEEQLEVDEEKKSDSRKLIIIGVAAFFCVALSIGGTYFVMSSGGTGSEAEAAQGKDDPRKKRAQAIYYQLEKPFIVSFQSKGKQRYMQVDVAFKSREQRAIDTIKKHLPVVKNDLNQVFGSKELEVLQTTEGLQQLNKEATEVVQAFLERETGSPGIEQVLFTSFVMQ